MDLHVGFLSYRRDRQWLIVGLLSDEVGVIWTRTLLNSLLLLHALLSVYKLADGFIQFREFFYVIRLIFFVLFAIVELDSLLNMLAGFGLTEYNPIS